MAEYIKRRDALKVLEEMETIEDGLDAMHDLPAADVVEEVHGRWKQARYTQAPLYVCSECDASAFKAHNYCPHCGAKMDGKENNE